MTGVLLSSDLTIVSRVQGAATSAGRTIRVAAGPQDAIERCRAEKADMLIIDLSTPALDIHTLAQELKSDTGAAPQLVAFGPHVHHERLAAAREAGCDEVISRGQFCSQLNELLRR